MSVNDGPEEYQAIPCQKCFGAGCLECNPETVITYDFNKEARIVCEAIGSTNGNATITAALYEAYQAGQRDKSSPNDDRYQSAEHTAEWLRGLADKLLEAPSGTMFAIALTIWEHHEESIEKGEGRPR